MRIEIPFISGLPELQANSNCIKKPYLIWQRGIIFETCMEGLNQVFTSKCTYVAAAMHPVTAVNTGTDVNRSPLTEISTVFKVEDAMKQFGTKISSSVSASLLFHLNSPEAFPSWQLCSNVSGCASRQSHLGVERTGACTLLELPSAVLRNTLWHPGNQSCSFLCCKCICFLLQALPHSERS